MDTQKHPHPHLQQMSSCFQAKKIVEFSEIVVVNETDRVVLCVPVSTSCWVLLMHSRLRSARSVGSQVRPGQVP